MNKIFKAVCLSLVLPCLLGIGANLQAGVITVSPSAFKPMNQATANDTQCSWFATEYWLGFSGTSQSDLTFVAPLNFPNGITIKKITIYLTHTTTGNSQYLTLELLASSLPPGIPAIENTIASVSTSNLPAAGGYQKIVLPGSQLMNKKVNNLSYSYCLRVQFPTGCIGSMDRLFGVIIQY